MKNPREPRGLVAAGCRVNVYLRPEVLEWLRRITFERMAGTTGTRMSVANAVRDLLEEQWTKDPTNKGKRKGSSAKSGEGGIRTLGRNSSVVERVDGASVSQFEVQVRLGRRDRLVAGEVPDLPGRLGDLGDVRDEAVAEGVRARVGEAGHLARPVHHAPDVHATPRAA